MAGKWDGKLCPACGQGTLSDEIRPTSLEYRGEEFRAQRYGAFCDRCGDGIGYNEDDIEQQLEHFRSVVDRNQSGELAQIRAKLRLTQEQASRLSGGGHNAFSRYERGEAQPVMGVVNLFRVLERHRALVLELDPTLEIANVSSPSPVTVPDFVLVDVQFAQEELASWRQRTTRRTTTARAELHEPGRAGARTVRYATP